jgi:small conductance mechanosensitive channel
MSKRSRQIPRAFDPRELMPDRMFETRSEAWEAVGLTLESNEKTVRRARKAAVATLALLAGVLVVYSMRHALLGEHHIGPHGTGPYRGSPGLESLIEYGTAVAVFVLGWAAARELGRAVGPTFLRRMDPATAGTVGFLVRLVAIAIALIVALHIAGISSQSLAVGGAFTAIVLGLAAQQTIGNLIAGLVLLSARPFRVGERVRLQAGALAGGAEGIVSELGLLYTTLARGEDRIMIPNTMVLSAAVVPLREPDSVDVKVRLGTRVRLSQLQALLDQEVHTPVRGAHVGVLLEEIDGDEVIVRVQATPERASDGARLADEIMEVLARVTREHALAD